MCNQNKKTELGSTIQHKNAIDIGSFMFDTKIRFVSASNPVKEFSPHCLIIDGYFVENDLTMIHLRHKTTNMRWHTRGKQTSIQK